MFLGDENWSSGKPHFTVKISSGLVEQKFFSFFFVWLFVCFSSLYCATLSWLFGLNAASLIVGSLVKVLSGKVFVMLLLWKQLFFCLGFYVGSLISVNLKHHCRKVTASVSALQHPRDFQTCNMNVIIQSARSQSSVVALSSCTLAPQNYFQKSNWLTPGPLISCVSAPHSSFFMHLLLRWVSVCPKEAHLRAQRSFIVFLCRRLTSRL